jgi:hypothetical protein
MEMAERLRGYSFRAHMFGHTLGHSRLIFAGSAQKTEGTRAKATVSLTVAFFQREPCRSSAAHHIERARMSSPLAAVPLLIASDGSSSTVDPSVDTSRPLRRHLSWMASA